jgi:phosphatidylinositol N-acetylglucosaminyltransferase subunit A
MMELAEPHEDDLVRAVDAAIGFIRKGGHDPQKYHESVKEMYSWSSVAERLEKTYDKARMQEVPDRITRLRK